MKKAICLCIFVLTATALLAREDEGNNKAGESSSSFNMSIGFRSYYAWWDPVWSRMRVSKLYGVMGVVTTKIDMTNKANFLYNPIVSFQFNEHWGLSASYSYGHYEYKTKMYANQSGSIAYLIRHDYDISKHDADLLANYMINRWSKLIFGLKYQGYMIEDKVLSLSTSPFGAPTSDNIRFHSIGGGIGMGFTVPLGADFYLFSGFSGIVLVGRDFAASQDILNRYILTTFAGIDQSGHKTFVIVGGMGSLSFAYYIKAIHLTIEAGARCQFLYYSKTPRNNIIQQYDLFFGPFLGVTYSFM